MEEIYQKFNAFQFIDPKQLLTKNLNPEVKNSKKEDFSSAFIYLISI